ncbi:MAG: 50S ribosomal protein L23 [Patescibacteria group bacterium]
MAIFNIFKKSRPQSGSSTPMVSGKPVIDSGKSIKKAPTKRKEIAIAELLKEPHISEKATILSENGKYVFRVYADANKSEIKKAVAGLYGVAVKDINIINIKPKVRIMRGMKGEKSGYKKAIVTLEKGHKIEILPH